MGLTVYRQPDVDRSLLSGVTVAIVGYGNQGHAHALNLRDSGARVVVGQRPGRSFDRAVADGFEPLPLGEAVAVADWVILTLPDEKAADVYARDIAPALKPETTLGFVHGFNIRFDFIAPPPGSDVIMVAPKGPGSLLRSLYAAGKGLPALAAVAQDASGRAFEKALAWADAIGSTRAGVLQTTFAEETETDLFGEQSVLCGGTTALVKSAFETLVEAGYQPEVAYFECMHELKLIVDLMYEGGMEYMRYSISDTAEYGDYTRGPVVVDAHVKDNMRKVLGQIQDGTFAREWILENQAGRPSFNALRRLNAEHPIEEVGAELRGMMAWLKKSR